MSPLQNWSKNVTFHERDFLQPKTLQELQTLVASNSKVRARGSAHCFNEIADTEFVSVNLREMPSEIEIDDQEKLVTVSAGMTYGKLTPELNKQGWALSNLASLPHISIGGSISTGTHGSGIGNKNLSNQVESFELINFNGEILEFKSGDAEFEAFVVGLGLGGIVYRYKLKIQPSYDIKQVVYPDILLEVLQNDFDSIMGSAYSVSYFTDWGKNKVGNLWCKYRDYENIQERIGGMPKGSRKYHPIPTVDSEACTEQLGESGYWYERLPHFKNEFTPSVGEEIQSEFFIDRKLAPKAIQALSKLGDSINPLLWITEIRTIASDNLWLSGAYMRDSVGIHFTWKKDDAIYPVIKEIEKVLQPFDYRPHWGKVFTADAKYLGSVYPKMSDFQSMVKTFDPQEKFGNAFTKLRLP